MLSNKKVKKDNTEEEKKIAEKLKEAISQAEETAIALDEEAMKEMDYFQHSPEEQLSMDIASHIADNAARRVGEILGDVDYDIARQLVIRFDTSDSKTAVSMIQAVLLSHGMKHAAEELDILADCERFDGEVYDAFFDDFFESDIIADYCVEAWLMESASDDEGEVTGWLRQ